MRLGRRPVFDHTTSGHTPRTPLLTTSASCALQVWHFFDHTISPTTCYYSYSITRIEVMSEGVNVCLSTLLCLHATRTSALPPLHPPPPHSHPPTASSRAHPQVYEEASQCQCIPPPPPSPLPPPPPPVPDAVDMSASFWISDARTKWECVGE